MTSAEASSAVAVAGSVCDDQTHVAVRLSDVADEDTPSDNKRPRLQDSTPDHQDVMGEENPDYPNEHRYYRGYAKVPTGGGMTLFIVLLALCTGLLTTSKNTSSWQASLKNGCVALLQ